MERDDTSLLSEGRAMVEACAADLEAVPDFDLVRILDAQRSSPNSLSGRIPRSYELPVCGPGDDQRLLGEWAKRVDGVMLIAPEWDGQLLSRCRTVANAGGRLLSPGPDFVEIAGSKPATADCLKRASVPVPSGFLWRAGESDRDSPTGPLVCKMPDGAGACDTRVVSSLAECRTDRAEPIWVEPFVPGLPASVAVLLGPEEPVYLPACAQHLTVAGHRLDPLPSANHQIGRVCAEGIPLGPIKYVGGHCPLPTELARRAEQLAHRTIAALPTSRGFVGIDMVLGAPNDGSEDVVVEVNPRLTTSYLGLRRVVKGNLAERMVAAALGDHVTIDVCGDDRVDFG